MGNYYYISSLLPELEIGHIPALNFQQLMALIRVNVSKKDQELIKNFLRRIDFENYRALWTNSPLDPHGNLTYEELKHSLVDGAWPGDESFPLFFSDYLKRYTSNENRVLHFPELMSAFYEYQIATQKGFLAEYCAFLRELSLIMVGFRAKLVGKDVIQELQFEDSKDPLVAQIIAQKGAKQFEPPFEYKELKPIFEEFQLQPLALHKALYSYQFQQIIERWGGDLFSIDTLLNYLARLLLVEKWLELDMQEGMKIVDSVEGNIR